MAARDPVLEQFASGSVALDAGQPACSADVAAEYSAALILSLQVQPAEAALDAGDPAARGFSLQTFSVAEGLPAEQTALPVRIDERRGLADETGNAAVEVFAVAALALDTDPLNIDADRLAAAQVPELRCDSIYPNRFCAAPIRAPSDRPSVAAHQSATR